MSKFAAVVLLTSLFLQNAPLTEASYAFTTETILEGGYDYSKPTIEWVYDPEISIQEYFVETYQEVEGAHVSNNDLVLDDEGFVHGVVSVAGVGLQYFTNESGVWRFTTLWPEAGAAGDVGIEIGSNGMLQVVYNSPSSNSSYTGTVGLRYFTNASGRWKNWEIESDVDGPYITMDFALDESNNGHLVYTVDVGNGFDTEIELHYAYIAQSAIAPAKKITVETIGLSDPMDCTAGVWDGHAYTFCLTYLDVEIAVDGLSPYIAYETPSDIFYKNKVVKPSLTYSYWTAASSLVAPSQNLLDVAFDSSKNFNVWTRDGLGLVQYVQASSAWTSTAMVPPGAFNPDSATFAFHPLNDNVVVGTSCYGGECKILRTQNGILETFVIDFVSVHGWEYYSSMVLDDEGNPHVLYVDSATPSSLKYAVPSNVYDEIEVGNYSQTSIDTDPSGTPYVAYYDEYDTYGIPSGDLKLATEIGGVWMTQVIDSTGDAGWHPDLFIDENGFTYISYYYAANGGISTGDLMLASNCSGIWATTTVDGSGLGNDVGEYSSIAVDASGEIHIAYYDSSNRSLSYASNPGCSTLSGAWNTEVIDDPTGSDVGEYVSMAVGDTGTVHVSYYDETNGDLKYASGNSGSWTVTTLDARSSITGEYSSLALDSNEDVHISYYEETDRSLLYITNSGGPRLMQMDIASGWHYTVIDDSTTDVGRFSSIDLNSNNVPYISYYDGDAGGRALRIASKTDGVWGWVTMAEGYGYYEGTWTSLAIDAFDLVHVSYIGSDSSSGSSSALHYLQF